MKTAILQSNYIPWKGYFDLIHSVDTFVIYDSVQYTKNDWRNRNKIVTNMEPAWLTIPVRQETLQQTIRETKVANPKWAKKHWRTIQQSYAKSEYFSQYEDGLQELYASFSGESHLSTINTKLITHICGLLGIKTKILQDSQFTLPDDRIAKLIEICQNTNATTYLSGPAAKDYLNENQFNQAGIEVEWINYHNYKIYNQNTNIFDHFVSILDVLFCYGNNFQAYLEDSQQ